MSPLACVRFDGLSTREPGQPFGEGGRLKCKSQFKGLTGARAKAGALLEASISYPVKATSGYEIEAFEVAPSIRPA